MKHLLNLTPEEADGYVPPFPDRSLGEPQPSPGWNLEYLQREGWRGLYTSDETILGWHELLAKAKENYNAGAGEWLNASMEMGDHMLQVLPPALQQGGGFATGEPWTHDGRGRAVYLCFLGFDWSRPTCQAQYLNIPDFVAVLTAGRKKKA